MVICGAGQRRAQVGAHDQHCSLAFGEASSSHFAGETSTGRVKAWRVGSRPSSATERASVSDSTRSRRGTRIRSTGSAPFRWH